MTQENKTGKGIYPLKIVNMNFISSLTYTT